MQKFTGSTHFFDAIEHNSYIFFSEISFNGLFRLKIGNKKVELLGRFPYENMWQEDLHRNVFMYNNQLYFIPHNGHGISIYNPNTKEFSFVEIVAKNSDLTRFAQCVTIGNDILLIPVNLNTPFGIFHLMTNTFEELQEVNYKIAKIKTETNATFFSVYSTILIGTELYLAVYDTNIFLKINLETLKIKEMVLPQKIHLRCVNRINDDFWFTLAEHMILQWNENGTYKLHNIPGLDTESDFPYIQILSGGNELVLLSGREDKFYQFNPISANWKDLSAGFPESFNREMKDSLLFMGYKIFDDNQLFLYPRAGNGILKYNFTSNKFFFYDIYQEKACSHHLKIEWEQYILRSYQIINERDFDIENFLDGVNTRRNEVDKCIASNFPVGEIIYHTITK